MDLLEVDHNLFLSINGLVGKNQIFDNIAKLMVNEYFIPTLLSAFLFALWFYWEKEDKDTKQKGVVAGVLGVGLGSLAVVSAINFLVQRARPFDILHVNLLYYRPTDPSFPANSAVVAFAIATAIYLAEKKLGIAALLIAAFYGFLRVFVGVHFPSDVLAGATVGIASTLFVSLFDPILAQIVGLLRKLLKVLYLEEFS